MWLSHSFQPALFLLRYKTCFGRGTSGGWSRLGAAFFFGLFHGLGFAGGLLDAMGEMPSATMLLVLLAFRIGVETGPSNGGIALVRLNPALNIAAWLDLG